MIWQASNDKVTWFNMPNAESARLHRYARMVPTRPTPQSIPEPAPELSLLDKCACGWLRGDSVHGACLVIDCDRHGQREAPSQKLAHHSFVAPQAKPVLREPMPAFPLAGEVWAYSGHEIGEVSKVVSENRVGNTLYFTNGHPRMYWNDGEYWARVRPAKPAAKDIPSVAPVSAGALNTEAARGGDAAITKLGPCGRLCGQVMVESECPQHGFESRQPSAVAAAPAIEPWRPSVDDWDLLADAETGWRR